MKKLGLTIPSAVLLTMLACKHEPPVGPDTPPVSSGCSPDTVYFQQQVLPILVSNCAVPGCHDAVTHEEGVNLTSYGSVVSTGEVKPGNPSKSKIYEVLFKSGDERMPQPPADPLTSEQKDLIKKWIEQGALNLACEDLNCDSTGVSFSAQVMPVIDNSCKGCHSGTAPQGGLKLTNYAEVKAATSFGLLQAIEHQAGFSAMPKGGVKLDACKLALIRNWILEGKKDN